MKATLLPMSTDRPLRFGIRDLIWVMFVIGIGLGWYRDRVNNHYAYNAKQFTGVLDAKQRAERELEQCRAELERCRDGASDSEMQGTEAAK